MSYRLCTGHVSFSFATESPCHGSETLVYSFSEVLRKVCFRPLFFIDIHWYIISWYPLSLFIVIYILLVWTCQLILQLFQHISTNISVFLTHFSCTHICVFVQHWFCSNIFFLMNLVETNKLIMENKHVSTWPNLICCDRCSGSLHLLKRWLGCRRCKP